MVNNKQKDIHIIDTRITWSGPRARDFLEFAKDEYGGLIPYGGIRYLIRLACIYYLESKKKVKNKESNNG